MSERCKEKTLARERGDTFYFTKIPCLRGHTSKRYVDSGNCWECRRIRDKERRKNRTPKERREFHLQLKHNISMVEFTQMLEEQNYSCAVCNVHESKAPREMLFVDHCHETNRIRGLLCSSCNAAIGVLGDSANSIQKVIEYLK